MAERQKDGEWIARRAGTDTRSNVRQSSLHQQLSEPGLAEAEHVITKLFADPLFLVLPQLENQQPPSRNEDADRLGQCAVGIHRVMEGLRKQREIEARCVERQFFQLPALPRDIGGSPTLCQQTRARERFSAEVIVPRYEALYRRLCR